MKSNFSNFLEPPQINSGRSYLKERVLESMTSQ